MGERLYVVDGELGSAGLFLVHRRLAGGRFVRVASAENEGAAYAYCAELNAKAEGEVRRG